MSSDPRSLRGRRPSGRSLPARRRPKSYHHGSLRRALLDAALTLIERHGPEGFTLRAAAREAGVTAGAPYHHFSDKDALVAALAEGGFEMLRSALETAGRASTSPGERAHEMAAAYVRFAVEEPTRFRLMMGRDAKRAMTHPSLALAAKTSYDLMRAAVVADNSAQGAALSEEAVLGSWSIVHGLAFLAIDGHLGARAGGWPGCEDRVRKTLRWLSGGAERR